MTSETSTNHYWYIVQVASNKEAKARDTMQMWLTEEGIEDSGIHLIEEETTVIRAGKKIKKKVKVFLGYLFLQMPDKLSSDQIVAIRKQSNVLGFVGASAGGQPIPMPEKDVRKILAYINHDSESIDSQKQSFVSGEEVEIIQGPFSDFRGTITNVNNEKGRLTVEVNTFNFITPFPFYFDEVQKTGGHSDKEN